MGLRDGYGVLLGTLAGYQRDDPNDFGRFMHGILTVATPGGTYKCAVDVDTRNGAIQVQWRIQPLRSPEWAALFALPDGWHPLGSAPSTGAVDYIRDSRLHDMLFIPEYLEEERPFRIPPEEWLDRVLPHRETILGQRRETAALDARFRLRSLARVVRRSTRAVLRTPLGPTLRTFSAPMQFRSQRGHILFLRPPWNAGTSDQALTDLESVITGAQRVIVFGAPFRTGRGVHDIHQNQGDPVSSSFSAENAIWQDGITIALRSDGTASAFMNKFSTQSDATDDNGRPISA